MVPVCFALLRTVRSMPAKIAMTVMTTSNSMRVKPLGGEGKGVGMEESLMEIVVKIPSCFPAGVKPMERVVARW